MEWLFRFLEAPFIWFSQRQTTTSPHVSAQAEKALGIGDSGHEFCLSLADLARHLYILGATGCGKTSLILRLIAADLMRDHTVVVVDLRGDLVRRVLSLCDKLDIDPSRITLLDLRETVWVQGFNPLAGAGEPYFRALHLLAVLREAADSWGVQIEESLRSLFLLLAECGVPLTAIERVFYDPNFRAGCLANVTDEAVLAFWSRYGKMSAEKQQAWALPALNKVTPLLAVPTLRNILSGETPLDLSSALGRKGQVVLVSLAVDELHRSGQMLGSIIVSAISREMMSRVNIPQFRLNPVRLYVDEFENMASEAFEGLIAEGRRFGLTLVLSHQTLSQLPSRLRSVVRNNVGVQILFQTGFEDARSLASELPDEITLCDLRDQSVGQAVVMFRDGSAERVQFHPPERSSSAASVAEYRLRVLSRLKQSRSTPLRAPTPVNPKFGVDPEDWL